MMAVIRKLVDDTEDRMRYAGMVIIAANAGGAWSPIGDITTTMLWVGGQITSGNIMLKLFIPALVSLLIPMAWMSFKMKGNYLRPKEIQDSKKPQPVQSNVILFFYRNRRTFIRPCIQNTNTPSAIHGNFTWPCYFMDSYRANS